MSPTDFYIIPNIVVSYLRMKCVVNATACPYMKCRKDINYFFLLPYITMYRSYAISSSKSKWKIFITHLKEIKIHRISIKTYRIYWGGRLIWETWFIWFFLFLCRFFWFFCWNCWFLLVLLRFSYVFV